MIVETKKGKLPVRYGMNALAKFGDLTGKSMNKVMADLNKSKDLKISELLAFLYVGFVDGARFADEECQVKSVADVGDMADDDPELMTKMFAVFSEGDEVKDGDKKKP